MTVEETTIVTVKKKRGRKPKETTSTEGEAGKGTGTEGEAGKEAKKKSTTKTPRKKKEPAPSEPSVPLVPSVPSVSPKKRGRKPNDYSLKSAESVQQEENIILHLPLKLSEIQLQSDTIERILKERPSIIEPISYTTTTVEFHSTMTRCITEDGQYKLVDNSNFNNSSHCDSGPQLFDEGECGSTLLLLEDVDDNKSLATYEEGPSKNVVMTREKYQPNTNRKSNHTGINISSLSVYDMKTFPLELKNASNIEDIKKVRVNTACWHCVHPFDTMPVYLPVNYSQGIFRVKGCFCSFNCVMAYGLNDRKYYNDTKSLTRLMYKMITGKSDYFDIKPAPSRYALALFGGILSIEEFRESFHSLNKYNVTEFPIINIIQQIEQIQITTVKGTTPPPSASIVTFQPEKKLRLQRTKKKENTGFNALLGRS